MSTPTPTRRERRDQADHRLGPAKGLALAVCCALLAAGTPAGVRPAYAQDEAASDQESGAAGDDTQGGDPEQGDASPVQTPDGDEVIDTEAGRDAGEEDVITADQERELARRIYTAPIPLPENADAATAAEYKAYQEAVQRYVDEVAAYRTQLSRMVMDEYKNKLADIDRVYASQIDEGRDVERSQRNDGIARLERFLEKHGEHSRYAPGVLYRLAVLYYEKADDDYYSADPATQTVDHPDFTTSIGYVQRVIDGFPEFQQIDGAYYLLGFCQLQMARDDEARAAFMALVEKVPESAKAPEAYTRIGEYYFSKSQDAIQGIGDAGVQWEKAREYYERAVAMGPEYTIYDRALYRLAWTEYYIEDYDSMLSRFVQLVEHADRVPQGSALRQEAIEFMAAALAEEDWNLQDDVSRDPDFGMVRFDRYLNTQKPFELEVLKTYADTLSEQARHDHAAEAYAALLTRDACNPENPKVHQALINALNLLERQDEALQIQAQLESVYGKGSPWYVCQEQNGNLEAIAYAEAMSRKALRYSIGSYHTSAAQAEDAWAESADRLAAAQGTDEQAELQSVAEGHRARMIEKYAQAAEVTAGYLDRYPNDQDIYLYRYIMADAYYKSEQYEKAAETFDTVRDVTDGRFRRDAANGAVDSRSMILLNRVEAASGDPRGLPPDVIGDLYLRKVISPTDLPDYLLREMFAEGRGDEAALEAELARREGLERKAEEPPEDVAMLIDAREKYVEYNLDERAAEGTDPLADDYRYLNALAFYQFHDFEQARPRFEEIIDKHPESDFAMFSAGFLIDTYQQEGDLDKVAELTDKLRSKRLGTGERAAQFETALQDIKYGALFEKARQLFDSDQYAEAAYEYERIANENPDFADIHLALYNAGVAYERIKRYDSAMRLYRRVYTEYNDKPEAADALYRVGVNGERFFDFDTAVDSYLELHDTKRESFVNHPERIPALRKAAVILKYTEDYAQAAKLFRRYHDEHQEQEDAPALLYESGVMYEDLGDYNRMASTFDRFRKEYGRDPDLRALVLESYVKQGDYFKARKDPKRARTFYTKALDLYLSNPGVGEREANYLAAKSQFEIADMDYQGWTEISLTGSLKVFTKKVQEKKEMSAQVASKFNQVMSFKNAEWTMAALFRIGSMLHDFGTSLETAPCPTGFDDFECEGFQEGMLEASFELKAKAREQYEAVVQFGQDNDIVNDWTRHSLNGLNDIAPKEFPLFEGDRSAMTTETRSPLSFISTSELAPAADRDAPKDLEDK